MWNNIIVNDSDIFSPGQMFDTALYNNFQFLLSIECFQTNKILFVYGSVPKIFDFFVWIVVSKNAVKKRVVHIVK